MIAGLRDGRVHLVKDETRRGSGAHESGLRNDGDVRLANAATQQWQSGGTTGAERVHAAFSARTHTHTHILGRDNNLHEKCKDTERANMLYARTRC